jgi:hypothetical protein
MTHSKEYKQAFIARQKDKGKCIDCTNPVINNKVRCGACLSQRQQWDNSKRNAAVANGMCRNCRKTDQTENSNYCSVCYLKRRAKRILGDSSHWTDLKDLLESQNGICPYTGHLLKVGANAEIDHRIPKTKGGTNDLANLQWVSDIANRMKQNLTEQEFKEMIICLYQHYVTANHLC